MDFFARRVSNQPTKWSTSKSGRRSIACSISTRVLIIFYNCKKKAGANQVFCESQFGEKGEKERAGGAAMRGSFSPKMKKATQTPVFRLERASHGHFTKTRRFVRLRTRKMLQSIELILHARRYIPTPLTQTPTPFNSASFLLSAT